MTLAGQNILVTGGSRGIGAAIVEAVAREGASPIIHYGRDRDAAEALLKRVGQGWCIGADFTSPAAPGRLFEDAVQRAGRIHGVVNNAGIRSVVEITASDAEWHAGWARDVQVNLLAAADIARAAVLHFRQHGGGRIIHMASRAGQRGYSAECIPYGATKAALLNLSKSLARSFGREGVVSIAIAPGWVRTDMAEDFVAAHGLAAAVADIPTGKMAEPAEVADLVAFALRASQSSLNGATLDLNGGSYIR